MLQVLEHDWCNQPVDRVGVELAGNTLTLNLAMTFKPAYSSGKRVYMFAADVNGVTSAWQERGQWTVP